MFGNLRIGPILPSDLDRLLEPHSEILSTVGGNPVVRFADRAQPGSVGKGKQFEGISSLRVGIAVLIQNTLDPDAHEPVPPIPALDNLEANSFAFRSLFSDQNCGHARVLELVLDPALDRVIALPLY